jgi:hypothetical protein
MKSNNKKILISKLTLDIVFDRLQRSINIEKNMLMSSIGDKPFSGSILGPNFKIHKKINYRNTFQTYLYGKITQAQSKSSISYHFGINRPAKIAMLLITIWLLVFEVWNISPRWHARTQLLSISKNDLGSILIPLFMIVFIWSIYAFGRWVARKEEGELVEFLKKALEAET